MNNKEIDFVGQVVSGDVAGILIREKNVGKNIFVVQPEKVLYQEMNVPTNSIVYKIMNCLQKVI